MKESTVDMRILDKRHFAGFIPVKYDELWYSDDGRKTAILEDSIFGNVTENSSWSPEIEEIHEEPTKNGWIDVYERERVIDTVESLLKNGGNTVVEFGASIGYMIEEMRNTFPNNSFIATDIMSEGLRQSYARNKDILHIKCDFTDAPFTTGSVDFVYSLNVLEHIEDDVKTMSECYRILKPGGYCLFVVPRGEKLYDYFDEMLFHKRRYAKGELCSKCESVGFKISDNFHFAWLCYPVFWIKKKWNRFVGKKLSRDEKLERVKKDIDNAMESSLAIGLMHFEYKLSKVIHTKFGVREFILCRKEEV